MSAVAVVATITPKPEHRDAVRDALVGAIPQIHDEHGCQRYVLVETDEGFITVEQWDSQADLDAHLVGPVVAAVMGGAGDLLAGPLAITPGTVVPAGDPAKGTLN